MAIEMKGNNTVGCAYYITIEESLYLQEDIPLAGIEIVETFLLQAQPTTVIINNRAPAEMVDYLEAHAQDLEGSQGEEASVECWLEWSADEIYSHSRRFARRLCPPNCWCF